MTYVSWPSSVNCRYSLIRLANAGFRYSGVADEILCDSCGFTIRDWTQHEDSDPVRQHAHRSPLCRQLPPVNATTSSGEIESDIAAGRPSLHRRSPATVTPRPSTDLPLAVPEFPPVNTGMASRDAEAGARSASNHASLFASGTDREATGMKLDESAAVTTSPACEAGGDGCCAAEPGDHRANMNTDCTNGSNNPGKVVCHVMSTPIWAVGKIIVHFKANFTLRLSAYMAYVCTCMLYCSNARSQ